MHDNPQPTPDLEFRLPGHGLLRASGRDAVAFLQAQCMNDVAALGDRQWQWNGWLTPKGRVVALFSLLRLDAETLWLVLPDVDSAALAADLQRYVFRSKVKLEPLDAWVVGRFAPPRAARGSVLDVSADGVVELDMGGDGGPRSLLISHAPAADDADAVARWTRADLAHGLPRLAPAQAGQWTPQQLSLERLNAFSVKKGCYPGQEIVARTHFLGQAKRGLALLQASTPVAAGADVMAAGRAIGIIASVQGPLALAVLPLERGDGVLEAGGVALQALTLLGGLAR